MSRTVLARSSLLYDRLEARWGTLATQRWIATMPTAAFAVGLTWVYNHAARSEQPAGPAS